MSVTLWQGDCLELLPTLEAGSIDAVICDPPYLLTGSNVPLRGKGVTARVNDSNAIGMPWGYSLDWVDRVARLEPKHWFVFCVERMLSTLLPALEKQAKLGTIFVWRKTNASRMARNVPRLDCEFIVWMKHPKATNVRAKEFRSLVIDAPFPQAGCFAVERVLMSDSKKAAHPTQKPLAIVRPFIERFTDEGQTILDPFMGSGTTGVACVQTGRNFIGIELDKGYFAISQRRIADAQAQLSLELAL